MIECTVPEYIELQPDIPARVLALDLLIDKMILSLAEQAGGGSIAGINEYQLDDGQIKIRTAYRSMAEVQTGILGLERVKQMYLNQIHGRKTILRDIKSFNRGC